MDDPRKPPDIAAVVRIIQALSQAEIAEFAGQMASANSMRADMVATALLDAVYDAHVVAFPNLPPVVTTGWYVEEDDD